MGWPVPPTRPLDERFWEKTRIDASGCIVWTAAVNYRGYGWFKRKGAASQLAHRTAYELAFGDVPDGMFVCHRCDNPACVNPAHLFVGTNADNMLDMKRKGRAVSPRSSWTHCIRGHELTEENTIMRRNRGRTYRRCRICRSIEQREVKRRRQARQRGQALLRVNVPAERGG